MELILTSTQVAVYCFSNVYHSQGGKVGGDKNGSLFVQLGQQVAIQLC